MEIFKNLHFMRPEWFWFLIPMIIFTALIYNSSRKSGNWLSVISPQLLPFLLISPNDNKKERNLLPLLLFAWLMICVAMAGPSWKKLPQPVLQKEDSIVMLLDLSASMLASDVSPSRVERAKQKLLDLLSLRKEGVTALIAYAGDAHVVTPLTDDNSTIANLLPALSPNMMPLQGSSIGSAIKLAQELLTATNKNTAVIVLISDGISDRELDNALKLLSDGSTRINILGIGTNEGAPIPLPSGGFLKDRSGAIVVPRLDATNLISLTKATGGNYTPLTLDDSDVLQLSENRLMANDAVLSSDKRADAWEDQGHWLILLVLPIALFSFRRGIVLSLPLFFLLNSEPMKAEILSDLWLTPDQRGMQALNENDPAKAAKLFENIDWAGTAAYRAKSYDQAIEHFSEIDNANGWYNLGNSLARKGDFPKAIEAYERSLEIEPDATDAIENLELLKNLQNQEQSNQDNKQGSDKEEPKPSESKDNSMQKGNGEQNNSRSEQSTGSTEPQEGNESTEENKQSNEQNQSQNADAEENKSMSNSPESKPDERKAQEQQQISEETQGEQESEQSTEQWLRRIPDDPSGLLREKFRYESMKRRQNGETSEPTENW